MTLNICTIGKETFLSAFYEKRKGTILNNQIIRLFLITENFGKQQVPYFQKKCFIKKQ